jgi:hypothetical protein
VRSPVGDESSATRHKGKRHEGMRQVVVAQDESQNE